MADLSYTVDVNTTGGVNNIKKLEKEVNNLNSSFIKLKDRLATISLTAIAASTLNFARSVQQASNATDIAVSTVNDFSNAVGQLGGSTNQAIGDVIDFVAGLKEAKDGSAGAQVSLAKVGVTLQDLASLSNEDIFQKTIKGLAQIEDAATRNALAVKLLGKNFKDIDVRQVASGMGAGGGANASAINAAAEAQKALSQNLNDLRSALINVAEPLTNLVSKMDIGVKTFETLIKVAGTLAIALLAIPKVMTMIGQAGAAFAGIFVGSGKAASSVKQFGQEIKYAGVMASNVINIFRSWALNLSASAMSFKLLGEFATIGITLILKAGLRLAGMIGIVTAVIDVLSLLEQKVFKTDYIESFFTMIAIGLEKTAYALGTVIPGMTKLAQLAEESRTGLNSTAGAGRGGNAETLKQQLDHAEKLRQETKKVVDANRGQRLEADKIVAAYKLQNGALQTQLQFQNTLIGKDEDYTNRQTKMFEIQQTYIGEINQLRTKYLDLQAAAKVGTDEEKAAFASFASVYQSTLNQIAKEYENQQGAVTKLLNQEQVLKAQEKDRQVALEQITQQMERQASLGDQIRSAYDKLKDVEFEGAQMQRSPLEQQYAQIAENARKAAREASLAFAQGFEGMDLSSAQAKELADGLEQIAQKYGQIADAQRANLDASRTWEQGWKEAFDKYMESATNAATKAGEVFGAITNNMNSAIDNFVTTGKFKFGDFARSVIQDLIKIELKSQATSLLKSVGGGLMSMLGGFFADGGQPPINKPSVVGENGPELFVPKTAGTIIPNGGGGGMGTSGSGGNTYITNNINALDAKSVAQLFAENRKTLFGSVEQARKEVSYGVR